MTSAEKAREFVVDHDLIEHVAKIVDGSPPLPERVAETWRAAAHRTNETVPER
jgi:hypothetical protein